jgi:hypothetical protein
MASACPRCTYVPAFTRICVIGPETGASTCVDRSPLKATVPVVVIIGRKGASVTVAIWRRVA